MATWRMSIARLADRVEVLADGGQRRDEVRRLGDVVEADDADVVAAPCGRPRRARAARRGPSGRWRTKTAVTSVRSASDPARPRSRSRRSSRPASGCEGPQPGGVHRVAASPASRARASVQCCGPATCTICGVPEVDQVLGGQPAPGDLVDADGPAARATGRPRPRRPGRRRSPGRGRRRGPRRWRRSARSPRRCWSRRWSTASARSSRVTSGRLHRADEVAGLARRRPGWCGARCDGPQKPLLVPITPMVAERRVTSARAAVLGR